MSELINNSEKRKELLKHMILQLHAGEAPEMVRSRLVHLLASIPYDEVVEVEQELIDGGLPVEEVLQLCDIHTMVLDGHIDQTGAKEVPPGHPVDTFRLENRELEKLIAEAEQLFGTVASAETPDVRDMVLQLKRIFNVLSDVNKHYLRKENLLFPFLEKYNITGPPKVMWGKHDETRALLKSAHEALQPEMTLADLQGRVAEVFRPAVRAIGDMIMKEEEILLPMCMDRLSDEDWYQVYQQTLEYGYCLVDPQHEWKPEGLSEDAETAWGEGYVSFYSGRFRVEELQSVFNTLPIDITFVDKDDKVRFFSMGPDRVFPRSRAILGRDVRMCHPPASMHVVDRILNDFRSGKENSAPFWINLHGKFIYIEYFAVRDKEGNYLGTLEFSQDLTRLRALEGEQRLLSYAAKPEEPSAGSFPGFPGWYHPDQVVVRFDARPVLAQGGHPVGEIMQHLSGMEPGNILEIITPFLPAPMFEKVREAGCDVHVRQEEGLFYSYFLKQ